MVPVLFPGLGHFQDTGTGVLVDLHFLLTGEVVQRHFQDIGDLLGDVDGGQHLVALVPSQHVLVDAQPASQVGLRYPLFLSQFRYNSPEVHNKQITGSKKLGRSNHKMLIFGLLTFMAR